MLIGQGKRRPDLNTVRRLKRALRETLQLPDEVTVTITELACLEEDCAPVETVFGLLRADATQVQHKIHKSIEAVSAEDLGRVGAAWGFDVPALSFAPHLSPEG